MSNGLAGYLQGAGAALIAGFFLGTGEGWYIYPVSIISLSFIVAGYHFDRKANVTGEIA